MDFSEILKPGLKGEKSEIVTERNTAAAWGSGGLSVYATPAMVALMEGAAAAAASDPLLPDGWSTVGTELAIKHLSASPAGMTIRAGAELLSLDGRALLFKVEAFDEAGKIGEGTHSRFIVENERFLKKASGRNSAIAK